jgi:DNA polymerase I
MPVGQWNVRLLASTYRRVENDQLTMELYGKVDDGRSITVRYTGFEPYFDLVEPTPAVIEQLRKDPDVRRVEEISLFYKGKLRPSAKVYVRFPWLVPDFRSRLRRDFDVLAADIPFHHRFAYDYDIGSCIRAYGKESVGEYRTDLIVDMDHTEDGKAPRFENLPPFNPDLRVLSFDIENSIKEGTILTICYVIREGGELRNGPPITGDERTIIDEFTRVIQEEDPDVITGYNIDNYDIPTVMERAKLARAGKLAWGRDLSEPRKVGLRGWRITGRLVVDAWWAAKMQLRPKQETLNHVAKLTLGEEKLDVEPSKMDEEWERDRDKVMRYCLKDAELALRILEYVGSVRRTMDLAAVSKLPMEDVQTSGNSTLIDSILIREADRVPPPYGPVGVPLTGNFDDDEEAIEGGYVHTIEPGLYHWVIVLDFKSMYPSLIINKNICFTTLSDDGPVVSPSGARFLSKDQREGLLPKILKDLMGQRDDIKRRMKQTKDPDEFRYYDGLQNAVKILMNAVYGVFASSFYRFTDRNIGSAITSFARETVKTLIARLEEDGINVVYGDSITADRFVTILNPEGMVQIKNIEELFIENRKEVTKRGEKEIVPLQGYRALSMLPSGESTWSEIKEIIKHRTDKKIYRVDQKYGESITTEDHSFLTWQENDLVETKPNDMLEKSMVRVEKIPPVKKVESLDMYELLKHYSYETIYKGFIKKSELKKDDEHVWFNWTERKNPIKLKRYIITGTPEFEALCRILGAYIAEGSSSTIETTSRNGASIASTDRTWLEQLCNDYYLLFSGTKACIIRSSKGTRRLAYNNDCVEATVLYEDHTHKLQMMNQMAAVFFKGLCGQRSDRKKLPDFIFHVDNGYKRILLEEMIKGDGSRITNKNLPYSDEYKKSFFKYETRSLQLACGISLLLNQLDEKYTMRYRERKNTYIITRTHNHYNKKLWSKIREEKYDGYVYDLSVEGTHAFVDSCGQILLHNTDSLFLQSPFHDLDGTVKFGTEISERFSREISQMEFQKVLEPLFSHGKKKRYVGRSVWPDNELLIRGYETRRTDAFDLQSEVLMSVFEKILDEKTEEAVKIARENVQKAMDCKVPIESLVISRTCKSFNSYKDPDSQANVQAARKLMAMGYEFVPGMKVSWIVTDSRKTPQEVEPFVSGRRFEHRPDCRYYAERVAQTAARATEVFGWGEKDLLTGSQQVTLFDTSFAGGSDPGTKKKEPESKRSSKKPDLRDFM